MAVLLDSQVPHVPGVAAVVPQHRLLGGRGEQPVPGHANTLSDAADISGEVTRGFLPGLKAGSPRYASDDRDARGADPHFHKTFSESFYVMEGTVRLFNGETWIDAVKGDFLTSRRAGFMPFPTRAVRSTDVHPVRARPAA